MSSLNITCPWALYLRFQHIIDSYTFTRHPINACEEILTEVLNDLADGRASNSDAYDRRVRNLSINRVAKHRHRSKLEQSFARQRENNSHSWDQAEVMASRELLNRVHEQVSPKDWQIFTEIAEGSSYRETATRFGMSMAKLKSRIHRIRNKLRKSFDMLTQI